MRPAWNPRSDSGVAIGVRCGASRGQGPLISLAKDLRIGRVSEANRYVFCIGIPILRHPTGLAISFISRTSYRISLNLFLFELFGVPNKKQTRYLNVREIEGDKSLLLPILMCDGYVPFHANYINYCTQNTYYSKYQY